jgi:1-deoxy-D-xylulose-5-phosphate reductoisomerase
MNAANEVGVSAFLEKRIGFGDLPKVIEKVLRRHCLEKNPTLAEVLAVDEEARKDAAAVINKIKKG